MSTKAVVSLGTTLGIDPAGGTSYITIAEVRELAGPGMERTIIDVTHLSSGQFTDSIAGNVDLGEFTLGINFIPAASSGTPDTAHYRLLQEFSVDLSTRTLSAINTTPPRFIITFANGVTWSFKGFVKSLSLNLDPERQVECDVTIKVIQHDVAEGISIV